MSNAFRPGARLDESPSTLHIAFRDPTRQTCSIPLEVIVDLDEYEIPLGLEILDFEHQIGAKVVGELATLVLGSNVRFSYDPEVDAAAIGVDVGTGTRTLRSIPRQARAGLDDAKNLLSVDVSGPWTA